MITRYYTIRVRLNDGGEIFRIQCYKSFFADPIKVMQILTNRYDKMYGEEGWMFTEIRRIK